MRTLFLLTILLGQGAVPAAEPDNAGDITQLTSPAASILRSLPGVAKVEVRKATGQPSRRMIHIVDWHFVDWESFAADQQDLVGEKLSDDEIDRRFVQHLQDVEAVQAQQRIVLERLIRDHDLKTVYQESLAPRDMPAYEVMIKSIRAVKERADELEERVTGVDDERVQELVSTFRADLRLELLRIGAAGQLYMNGLLKSVLPVEDVEAFDGANPITAEGKVDLDARLIEAREDALVKVMAEGDPVAVVILGGGHDLADNVPKGYEYLRVVTREYQKVTTGGGP